MSEVNGTNNNVRYIIPPATPRLLWTAIALLALVVAGQGWYIHQIDVRSANAATTVAGQQSLTDLKVRLDALETNQKDWARHAIGVDVRVDTLATNQKDWNRHVIAIDAHSKNVDQAEHADVQRLEKELARTESTIATR